jgi:hypothetical protein
MKTQSTSALSGSSERVNCKKLMLQKATADLGAGHAIGLGHV